MDGSEKRGRKRSFEPEAVLDQAMQVFWRQGYAGTSYSDLTAATGLNKPSLYAAFGDKEALFAAALERYSTGPNADAVAAFEQTPDFRAATEAMLRNYTDFYTAPDAPPGCLILTSLSEAAAPDFPPALYDKLHSAAGHATAAFTRRIARAASDGDLPERFRSPEGQAALHNYLTTFSLGIASAARAGVSRDKLAQAVTLALGVLA